MYTAAARPRKTQSVVSHQERRARVVFSVSQGFSGSVVIRVEGRGMGGREFLGGTLGGMPLLLLLLLLLVEVEGVLGMKPATEWGLVG
jgi:hypothetical protein